MRRHKIKQRIMAMVLSAIMVMGLTPVSALAETGTLPICASSEITAFEALGSKIAMQSVPLGTTEADLKLPDTLTAIVRLMASGEDSELDSGKAVSDSTAVSGSAVSIDEMDDAEPSQGAEITIPLSVTWVSSPEYNGEVAGTYHFTPALPEGFVPARGVKVPAIAVTVGVVAVTGTVTAFDELPKDIRWQSTTAPEFPKAVGGTVKGEATEIPVTWKTEQEYNAEYPVRGLYVFTAILDEDYEAADGLELPRMTIYISQTISGRMMRMAGGGTTDSPLNITTASQLVEIAALVNARENGLELFLFNDAKAKVSLKLQNDIDLSAYSKGEGWVPIGNMGNQFKGTFDGGGHKISNLTIDRVSGEYQGLFGYIGVGAVVENLGVVNATILAKSYAGGVTGSVRGGTIQNCYTTGSVSGKSYLGGLVGCVSDGSTVQNCYSTSSIVGFPLSSYTGSFMIGGLAGAFYDSTVKACYVTGSVVGNADSPKAIYTGGLAGYFAGEGIIQNCAALNHTVVGAISVGRIIGNWPSEFPVGNSWLSDNISFGGMTVTDNGSAKIPTEGADQVDGKSQTAADIKAAGFFEALFDNNADWAYAESKLPGFGVVIDMPEYLVDGSDPNFLGAGTSENPYQIATSVQLAKLAELVNAGNTSYNAAHYKLMNDLDISGYKSGEGWIPIGIAGEYFEGGPVDHSFKGIFDGGGKRITGLYITDFQERYITEGLFGYLKNATVKNLGVVEAIVKTRVKNNVGGLAGKMDGGMVQNCYVIGSVVGNNYIGGIVGRVSGGIVKNCYSSGLISMEPYASGGHYMGGVVGIVEESGMVENCYSTAALGGAWIVGGVVGLVATSGTVQNCYSTGSIRSRQNSGGVVGVSSNGVVKNCAALNASVSADSTATAGRVVGRISIDSDLSDNIVFEGMMVNGHTVSGGTLTDNNGAGKSVAEISAAGFWTTETGFTTDWDTTLWTIEAGRLPILKGIGGQVAFLPTHLFPEGASLFEGAGTSKGDPYLIKTAEDLAKLANLVNAGISPYANEGRYYKLVNDLDLSGYASGEGWVSIGIKTSFKGNFDGNNKSITGMAINRPAANEIGLFGRLYPDSKVQNLSITGVSVTGSNSVGGVVGYAWGATIENCAVSGSISGVNYVGGIAGITSSGTVDSCYSTGSVTVTGDYVGGVVGYLEYNTTIVQSCYSNANVTGSNNVGGVAGEVGAATVQNCYNTANVTGSRYVGSVAGRVGNGTVQNCYSIGSVSGLNENEYIGGLVGVLSSGTVKNCVALNRSIHVGTYNFGRMVGSVGSGTLSNNYAFISIPGTWVNKGLNAKDGVDVTLQTLFGSDFWTRVDHWYLSTWDSSIWSFVDNKLPTLTGLAGQSGEGGLYLTARDIQYATVGMVDSLIYNGSEQVPALEISFDGENLTEGKDYIVSVSSTDGSGTSAGTKAGVVTRTITGIGSFKGTKTVTHTIDKAQLVILGASIDPKTYDGSATAEVAYVKFSGLQHIETLTLGTDYTVTGAQFSSADAGDKKIVTAMVKLANTQKANNYILVDESLNETGLSISKAAAPTVPNIAKSVLCTDTASQTVNIAGKIASYKRAGDTLTYTVGTVSGANPGNIQTPSVNGEGVLTFKAKGSDGDTATIPVTVKGFGNYYDITVNVVVTLIDKTPVTITATMNGGVYTGSAYSYTGAIVKRNDNNADVTSAITLEIKYESTDGAGYSNMDAPMNVGAYKLTLSVPDSNPDYIGSEVFIFTIEKRQITLTADNKTVVKGASLPQLTYTVGNLPTGKTRADALSAEPVLACPTFDGNTQGSYAINLTDGMATDNYTITTRTVGTLTVAEQTYTVTFNLNGGWRTGGGELTQTVAEGGEAIAPTVSRNGYTFTGWDKVYDNVTSDLTVSANWRYDGGGGDSGNPSDNSPIIVTPPAAEPDSPTQGEFKVPGTVDSMGSITVTITDKAVTDAFDMALADAKKNGKEQNGITVVLRVDTGSKIGSNVTVILPKTVQDTIIEKKIVKIIVVVDNPYIRISMDLATVQEINKQAKSDVNITATRADNSKLIGDAKKAIGSRPVFDLTVNYGSGKKVRSFGSGRVSVTIPYTLGANEKAGNVQAVYVDDKGKVHWLVNSVYDSVEKVLHFSTDHFSTYGIGYRQTNTAFTDIAGHWAKKDIEFVVSRGLLVGITYTFDQYGVTADVPKNLKYATYTVQKGNSFWLIVRKLGFIMSELGRLNK